MLVTVINFCLMLLILGLCFVLVVWVLGLIGVPVPDRAVKIIGAIVFLIVLLWFLQAVVGGGHFPRLLAIQLR